MPYSSLDFSRVKTYSLAERTSRVAVADLVTPNSPLPNFESPDLEEIAVRIIQARRKSRPVIWMIGGHVIKRGLAPLLIDLVQRGVITHIAGNGASTIHDFEIAFQGNTSEDVASSLEDGSFGMADETGAFMNQAIQNGFNNGMGIGEALGQWIEENKFPFREFSLLYNAWRFQVPYTVHVAIGTDIIHQHPICDFAALGWGSGQDFKIFSKTVSELEEGVFCNFGSSVIGPEVFLKAISITRNLGYTVKKITTVNFDLIPLGDYRKPISDDEVDYYYRPRKNIINRPTSLGGKGFHIQGDHRDTIPTLSHMLRSLVNETPLLQPISRESTGSNVDFTKKQDLKPECLTEISSSPIESSQNIKAFLSRNRLLELLDSMCEISVGVVGDFTLDAYWYADMTRSQLSRETPLYPRPVVRETYSPGGAANVAWNLADLGVGKVEAFTTLGYDWRGVLFTEVLQKAGISIQNCVYQKDRFTPLYGKVILMNQHIMQEDPRLDFINLSPPPENVELELLQRISTKVSDLDALVVADYQPNGIFSTLFRNRLNEIANNNPDLVCVADSREAIGSYPAMILKPNEIEASRFLFPNREPDSLASTELISACLALHQKNGKSIVITQAEKGCLLFSQGQFIRIPAVLVLPPIDSVGAGDTFVACLSAALAVGASPKEAAALANLASAVTIRILHITGTASPQSILELFDNL